MRSMGNAHLRAEIILILTPVVTFLNLAQQVILICCFLAILSLRKPPRLRNMRKFWSNSRVRIKGNENRRGEDSSCSKSIEVLLRGTTRKNYPNTENVGDPVVAPQDYVRQSGRGLELQKRDLLDTTNRSVSAFSHSCDHS